MSAFAVNGLNEIIHVRARLAVIAFLSTAGDADFSTLREQIGISDGNLSLHLRKLEEIGYIVLEKKFIGRRPKTLVSLTTEGRSAFREYLNNLQAMLGQATPPRGVI